MYKFNKQEKRIKILNFAVRDFLYPILTIPMTISRGAPLSPCHTSHYCDT